MLTIQDLNKIILYFIVGLLLCVLACVVIKQVSEHVAKRNYKIIYWKYVIPISISAIGLIFGITMLTMENVNAPEYLGVLIVVISTLFALVPMISCILKMGLFKGICMFLVQSVCAVMCAALVYAQVAAIVFIIVASICAEVAVGDKYFQIISDDLTENEFVICSGNNMWIDREGRLYYGYSRRTLSRQEDSKMFHFI
jgi:hypothetical protein